ncbi:MAG: hypothetical protein OEZ34_16925, partial [Spirochaetia bacterium]|nr:hypothetical protein [Spirochaetia bacterium]
NIKLSDEEGGLQIWQIGRKHSHLFTDVAIKTYLKNGWITASDLDKLYREDVAFAKYGVFLAIRHEKSSEILATFRLTRKHDEIQFPFETFFGLSIKELCANLELVPAEIWHGGRIVVNKEAFVNLGFKKNYSVNLIWTFFRTFYRIITRYESNLFIGENQIKAHRYYSMLGFKMTALKEMEYFPGYRVCASYVKTSDLVQKFEGKILEMEQEHQMTFAQGQRFEKIE